MDGGIACGPLHSTDERQHGIWGNEGKREQLGKRSCPLLNSGPNEKKKPAAGTALSPLQGLGDGPPEEKEGTPSSTERGKNSPGSFKKRKRGRKRYGSGQIVPWKGGWESLRNKDSKKSRHGIRSIQKTSRSDKWQAIKPARTVWRGRLAWGGELDMG